MKKTFKKIKKVTNHHHFFPSLAIFFGLVAIGISISAQVSVWADNDQQAGLAVGGNSPISTSNPVIKTNGNIDSATVAKPSCSYSYGDWSECDSSGRQKREVKSKSPDGCVDESEPEVTRSCTYVEPRISCSYTYSSWSECDSSGRQTREIKSKSPSGCIEDSKPDLSQSCNYVEPKNIENENNIINQVVSCSYSYSGWNSCNSSGKQFRSVTSKSPSGCIETIIPVLEQSCTYNISNLSITPKATENEIENINNNGVTYKVNNPSVSPSPVNLNNQQNNDTKIENTPLINKETTDLDSETSTDWQKFYFGSMDCLDFNICGKLSDPDNDGLNNDDEYRFGTNPISSDTDQDGFIDSEEIKIGFNPSLKALTGERNDKIIFESPKEKGEINSDIYKIGNVEMIEDNAGQKKIRITGKALPNSFVTIYIYSDPIILTVKTDTDGSWSYELDNEIENGEHEIYVAVTDNTGKINEKSQSFAFIKTADAISIIPPIEASAQERTISPTKSWSKRDGLFFIAIGLGGLALSLAAIGILKYNFQKKSE